MMNVFISHSTKDMQIVDEFANILRLKGIEVYLAVLDAQPGTDLWGKIQANIRNSSCVLAIMTIDGSRSDIVNQEIATANAFKIPVVPIVEKGVTLKGVLVGKEYIEFDKNNPKQAYINADNYLDILKVQVENKKFIGKLVLAGLAIWLISYYGE
ncbi:MAG: toll/interleukin-1 receptor domain-containing protein [Candidatus Omnitrophota bacterium]